MLDQGRILECQIMYESSNVRSRTYAQVKYEAQILNWQVKHKSLNVKSAQILECQIKYRSSNVGLRTKPQMLDPVQILECQDKDESLNVASNTNPSDEAQILEC